jgi:hypothetical protein
MTNNQLPITNSQLVFMAEELIAAGLSGVYSSTSVWPGFEVDNKVPPTLHMMSGSMRFLELQF